MPRLFHSLVPFNVTNSCRKTVVTVKRKSGFRGRWARFVAVLVFLSVLSFATEPCAAMAAKVSTVQADQLHSAQADNIQNASKTLPATYLHGKNTQIPTPAALRYPISVQDNPIRIMEAFLGIPYRMDAGIDEHGEYVFFAKPKLKQPDAALNCSGFVLGATRFILGRNLSLDSVQKDRMNDSGKAAPLGEDWDFGWDLILNISEGFARRFITPRGGVVQVEDADALSMRGFDMHEPATWDELQKRLVPGKLYLLSFNRDVKKSGYKMLHYHVGIIYLTPDKNIWMYQTTNSKVYKRSLSGRANQESFYKDFANKGNIRKYIAVLEVDL